MLNFRIIIVISGDLPDVTTRHYIWPQPKPLNFQKLLLSLFVDADLSFGMWCCPETLSAASHTCALDCGGDSVNSLTSEVEARDCVSCLVQS